MATTIVGQSCKLLKVISGLTYLQISHIQQLQIAGLQRSIWSGIIRNAKRKENLQLKNVPPRPKMPANAFLQYLEKVEKDIQKMYPGVNRTIIISKASQMWQELDPEEKSHLAIERKEKYLKYKDDLKAYLENMTPEQIKADELKKVKRAAMNLKQVSHELGKPRKPPGSFNCYVSEKFAERTDEKITSYFKHMSNEWAKMSDTEKEIHRNKAHALKEKYDDEIASWENKMITLGRFDVIRKTVLRKLIKKDKNERTNKVGFSVEEGEDNKQ